MFNRYTLRARVYPGLLALSPVLVSGILLFPEAYTGLSALGSLLIAMGALYLVSHVVRRVGKSREPVLWKGWGGKPTSVKLRWRTVQPTDVRDLNRSRVTRLASDVRLASRVQEQADPTAADRSYDAAVAVLREATRDRNRYPLVFAENVSYGFRRNSWAVRPLGVLTSSVATGALIDRWVRAGDAGPSHPAIFWTVLALDILFLAFWLFGATRRWVKEAADAYTEALFSAAAVVLKQ